MWRWSLTSPWASRRTMVWYKNGFAKAAIWRDVQAKASKSSWALRHSAYWWSASRSSQVPSGRRANRVVGGGGGTRAWTMGSRSSKGSFSRAGMGAVSGCARGRGDDCDARVDGELGAGAAGPGAGASAGAGADGDLGDGWDEIRGRVTLPLPASDEAIQARDGPERRFSSRWWQAGTNPERRWLWPVLCGDSDVGELVLLQTLEAYEVMGWSMTRCLGLAALERSRQ